MFVCENVSGTLFDICFWNGEQRAIQVKRRPLSVWLANASPSGEMWSGQLSREQGDVCTHVCMCVCVCFSVCVWVFVFVCKDVSRMLFNVYFSSGEQRAIQLSCQTLSVWIANAGPSVVMCSKQLWRGRGDVCERVWSLCGCMLVFVCEYGYWKMNDEDAYEVMLRSISCEQWTPL